MHHVHTVRLSVTAVLISAATIVLTAPANAEAPTCDGKPATIVGPGPGNVIHGTPGDDVVVTVAEMANGPGGGIYTYEGNDTVCIVPGTGAIPYWDQDNRFTIDSGAGDDVVLNQEPRNTSDLTVILGAGADTFVGNDRIEHVYAGVTKPGTGWLGLDDAHDTISTAGGNDRIHTGYPGTANTDTISTGPGDDEITLGGTGTVLDNGVEDGRGDRLLLVTEQWNQSQVTLDNRTRTATGDTGELVGWNNVHLFEVHTDIPLRYIGSDDRDVLYLASKAHGDKAIDVSLNGGDDYFWFYDGVAPGRIDGGAGDDTFVPETSACVDVTAVLDATYTCATSPDKATSASEVAMAGFETYNPFYAKRHLTVTGTDEPDEIYARAPHTRVKGLGGRDTITADYYDYYDTSARSVVRGGTGADRLTGGRGKETLIGGRGGDVLIGKYGNDRLRGGRGKDKARGGPGTDRCGAETRKSCEKR